MCWRKEIGIPYRIVHKTESSVGYDPERFIRIIRLKKAAVLLSQDGVQVSEACFRLVFISILFCKMFQAQFGVAPTEFKRMKTVN